MKKYLILLFLLSCNKGNKINKYCLEYSVFKQSGIIVDINIDSGSYNTIDYLVELTDSGTLQVFRDLRGNMYFSISKGDSIVKCQK